ncbi:MAG TPA: hypothetical protein PLU35_08650 [Phycisphaerales bacterium]|nr:hypothetical protein [Phycisphaerales bacterium]
MTRNPTRRGFPTSGRGLAVPISCFIFLLFVLTPQAFAQDADKPEPQPERDTLPDLDELLGLPSEKPADAPAQDRTTELDRLLSGEEIAEAFVEAVRLMGETAARLDTAGDTGVVTQRMQEDAIRKLDKLIADAQNRRQQSRSQSRSQQNADQQSQQQPAQRSAQRPGGRDNQAEVDPPARQDGPLNPAAVADLAAWGALPERVREALVQGSSDRFSTLYQRLTEAYYKRLAEERDR